MMEQMMRNDRYQMNEVLSAVLSADSVLLFSHVSPDGDTLGSALALCHRLHRLGNKAWVMVDGEVPDSLRFLPASDEILSPDNEIPQVSLCVAVDVASVDRLGKCSELFHSYEHTALIDHHGSNLGYAQVNMIDDEAPATAILIGRLFEQMECDIDCDEAVCLYTALSTDTGNFIYDSTNSESFLLMSKLMETGFELPKYSRLLFRQKEAAFVRLLGEVLPSLRITHDGQITGLSLRWEQMLRSGASNGHTDGIVDYAIDIKGARVAYFVRETEDGSVRVSLRALGSCAVDGVAKRFGGGGHRLAAGATLHTSVEEAVRIIEQALEELL